MAYGEIRLALKTQLIDRNDMWIAAHAVALDLTLVTNNTREFSRVPRLVIDNWLEGQTQWPKAYHSIHLVEMGASGVVADRCGAGSATSRPRNHRPIDI